MKDPVFRLSIYLLPINFGSKNDCDQKSSTEFYITDNLSEGEFKFLNSTSEVCPQVASCGLPAVHLTEQHLCITGLCSGKLSLRQNV